MLKDLFDMGQWKASTGSMGLGMIIGKRLILISWNFIE